MAEDPALAAAAAFARKVQRMLDLADVDMKKFLTQTARKNHDELFSWANHMWEHEAQTIHRHERVYLVASDLRLVLTSRNYSGYDKWQKTKCKQRSDAFLEGKDIETLHEKHWAVEIDGRYYELVRGINGSRFSSENPVERCDRRITARIFIGTTHCKLEALREIGQAVIATQTKYELTRDNCHRFVRVFTALTLCPNHHEDTLSNLPFTVEEIIATNHLNQYDGCQGFPSRERRKYSGFLDLIFTGSRQESDSHRASRLVGEGAQWALRREEYGSELSLIVRRLVQRTSSDGEGNTTYYDQFKVHQEQMSYFLEHDASLFSQCKVLDRSPYLSVVRFDKATRYSIIPRSDKYNYKPECSASGMITGPYGVTLSRGLFKQLRPSELIRDHHGIWRDGDGTRLAQPKSTLHLLFAELHDFFSRTNRGDFDYQVPTLKLFGMALGKSAAKITDHPCAISGVIGLAIAAALQIDRKPKHRSPEPSRSRARVRPHSVDYSYTESSMGSRSLSCDRYFIQ